MLYTRYLSTYLSIYRSIHPSIHACMHAACMHAYVHAYTHTFILDACIHTHMHTYVRTYMHACMHICACIFMLLRRSVRQGSEFCPWPISHDQCSRQNTHIFMYTYIRMSYLSLPSLPFIWRPYVLAFVPDAQDHPGSKQLPCPILRVTMVGAGGLSTAGLRRQGVTVPFIPCSIMNHMMNGYRQLL